MLLTELFTVTQPFLLGKGVDGLLVGSYFWVILLGITFFMSNLFNYKRMGYDTKVYTQIYNDTIFKFIRKTNVDDSTKIARTDMVWEVVNVLEGYVHYYIATIVTIIGSIGFIYLSNYRVGIAVTLGFIFILASVMVYYKKIKQSILVRNNHYEDKVKALQLGDHQTVSFFNRHRKLIIYGSTLQGKNWFLVNLIKHVFLLMSIILLVTTTTNISVGTVIMTYAYIDNFLMSLMSIPVAIEMWTRITDILKRI